MRRFLFQKSCRAFWWVCAASLPLLSLGKANAAEVTVQVVSADAKNLTLTVKGKGLTDATKDGTQVVSVGAGDAAIGYVGHNIRGDLAKSGKTWRLENIWPADLVSTVAVEDATKQLNQELVEMGRKAFRSVGDSLPPFVAFNQNGEMVRPSVLRGQWLVVNFIFTKCTNPNMCPANTQRMAQLQKDLKKEKIDNVTLVTFSFDPEYDTPGILRQYAQSYGLDLKNFQLLTAPKSEMDVLLQHFGILLKQEDGTLQHTMATLIVSPEGRIAYRRDGENWSIEDFIQRLRPAAKPAEPAAT